MELFEYSRIHIKWFFGIDFPARCWRQNAWTNSTELPSKLPKISEGDMNWQQCRKVKMIQKFFATFKLLKDEMFFAKSELQFISSRLEQEFCEMRCTAICATSAEDPFLAWNDGSLVSSPFHRDIMLGTSKDNNCGDRYSRWTLRAESVFRRGALQLKHGSGAPANPHKCLFVCDGPPKTLSGASMNCSSISSLEDSPEF